MCIDRLIKLRNISSVCTIMKLLSFKFISRISGLRLSAMFHRLCCFSSFFVKLLFSAVLSKVKNQYGLDDKKSGFLQTAFVISYMIFAPVFGYLGDRYSRKVLMAGGVIFWSITTLLGSLPPEVFYSRLNELVLHTLLVMSLF